MPRHRVLYRFGSFEFDPSVGALFSTGNRLNLSPRLSAVLTFLVENSGRLVYREELLSAAWPNITVAEANVNFAIFQLRRVLEDDSQLPKYIQTIPRRGFRFIADVETISTEVSAEVSDDDAGLETQNLSLEDRSVELRTPLWRRWGQPHMLLILLVAGLTIFAGVLYQVTQKQKKEQPFVVLTIRGPSDIGFGFLPTLLKGYLEREGYQDLAEKRVGTNLSIEARKPSLTFPVACAYEPTRIDAAIESLAKGESNLLLSPRQLPHTHTPSTCAVCIR